MKNPISVTKIGVLNLNPQKDGGEGVFCEGAQWAAGNQEPVGKKSALKNP